MRTCTVHVHVHVFSNSSRILRLLNHIQPVVSNNKNDFLPNNYICKGFSIGVAAILVHMRAALILVQIPAQQTASKQSLGEIGRDGAGGHVSNAGFRFRGQY